MSDHSFRTILRASSIIGGASAINILAGLVKMKVAALLVGPAGVGLVGLYQSIMQTAASVGGLGVGMSGTRQVAAATASGDLQTIAQVHRALVWGTLLQAIAAAGLFWLFAGSIARQFVGDVSQSPEVAWLALGVALTIAAAAQNALLTGMRRVGDIARVQVSAGLVGAMLSVAVLWRWGSDGLIATVLIAPGVSFVLGYGCITRLRFPPLPLLSIAQVAQAWGTMARLGSSFMFSTLVTVLGFLALRLLVQRELGVQSLGYFQAAWSVGNMYLGYVLGAMSTDYYPRLTSAIEDPVTAVRLVNEQTEISLLLCGPVVLALVAVAPWLITLLYSRDFHPAVDVLRWQLLGDILKVMSWPLSFIILARGAGKTFIFSESIAIGVLVTVASALVPLLGVQATGVSYLMMYIFYLPLTWWLGRQSISFVWTRPVIWQGVSLFLLVSGDISLSVLSEEVAMVVGLILAIVTGTYSLIRIAIITRAKNILDKFAYWKRKIRQFL